MEKKNFLGIIFVAVFVLLTANVFASPVEVNLKPIKDVVISELNKPAVFEVTIKNIGDDSDVFEIYSLANIEILPKSTFDIKRGEIKTIKIEVYPASSIKERVGLNSFVYKIRGQLTGIQDEVLSFRVVRLKDLLQIFPQDVDLNSEKAVISIQNNENIELEKIKAVFNSALSDGEETFSLKPFEKKEISLPINKEKARTLIAGKYILTANIFLNNAEQKSETSFYFLEKPIISSEEVKSGFFIKSLKSSKTNNGNIPKIAEVRVTRNFITDLFTNFNVIPDYSERNGLKTAYVWQKELRPSESLIVTATTNFVYPILLLLGLIIIIAVVNYKRTRYVILQKSVIPVKTKGGEFALKVIINLKTKRFVEKITLIDKLPPSLHLHERFGTIAPERIDAKKGRVEWNLNDLHSGEERVVSYIMYSKVGLLGKFELPRATAIFERLGVVHETESNRTIVSTEADKNKE